MRHSQAQTVLHSLYLACRICMFDTKDITDAGPHEAPSHMLIIIHNRQAVSDGERC